MEKYLYKELTSTVLGVAMNIHNDLGSGFLEKIYENAMLNSLNDLGYKVDKQSPIEVMYKGKLVGQYYADLVVDNKLIIELKAIETISENHKIQVVHYLKATELKVGLLINFGAEKLQYRRIVNTKKIKDQ